MKRTASLGIALACASLCGCGGSIPIYEVSGTVTYQGKPLPAGVIYFDPDVTQKNDGPQGYAIIRDGQYNTDADGGMGVVGGAYLVRIEGFDGKPGNELPLGKPIFTDYQKAVDLPKANSTQDFDVPARKRNKN